MRVAVLVGNSRVRIARVAESGERRVEAFAWDARADFALPPILREEAPQALLVASVRDDLLAALLALLPPDWPHPTIAGKDLAIPIENRYEPPAQVGTDRLLNALAARELYPGRPAIAVDFGTALSFSAVDRGGVFAGGLIAAGASGLLDSLARRTPQLPRVSLESLGSPEARERRAGRGAIERSTRAAIASGVARQFVGGVRAILRALIDELGADTGVVATGGEAEFFAAEIPEIDRVEENLTLDGLLSLGAPEASR